MSPKKNMSRTERQANNPIEKWLKTRFRDGFVKIKASFEEIDRQRTGQVFKYFFSIKKRLKDGC